MRKLILLALVVLVPGVAASQTMGLYFEHEQPVMHKYTEGNGEIFEMYLYVRGAAYNMSAVEYKIYTPDDPDHLIFTIISVEYPDNMMVTMGHPFAGHQVAFYPPMMGVNDYCHVCTIRACTLPPSYPGLLCDTFDFPITIGPDPGSGHLRAAAHPNMDLIELVGLTSTLNPKKVPVRESSWGEIKARNTD